MVPVARLVAMVVAVVVSLVSFSTPAEAIEVPAHNWNLCSNPANTCWAEAGPGRLNQLQKGNAVNYLVLGANPRPWFVAVEEVCSDTYIKIRDALAPQGYLPDRVIVESGIPNCGSFGSAMFTLGGIGSWDRKELASNRAIGCRIKTTYVGKVKFCVTHTLGSGQNSAAAGFYYGSANGMSHDQRMLGGDLNAQPSQLGVFYAFNEEIDYRSPPANTHNTQRATPKWKIDYIFTSIHSFRVPGRICDPSWSDHCYLYGSFLF